MLSSSYYFAYGSNMNPARVRVRNLELEDVPIRATLTNYVLRFNKKSRKDPNAGHANIVPKFGVQVEGVLYPLRDAQEIEKMDPFESAPSHYRRELVFVRTDSRLVLAWTYIANPSVVDETLLPPKWYVEHLLAGAEFLSPKYIDKIRQVECLKHLDIEPI